MLRRTSRRSRHHVVPRDLGRAGGRREQGGEHPQGRGLAGAVRAEEGDQLAGADLEVEAADRLDGLLVPREGLRESARPDHRTCLVGVVAHGNHARNHSGQFLTAFRISLEIMNTSARMLRLLSLLQTHRYWPGGELSERLEVSPRTLRRDIDRLRDLGYHVDAVRGVAGGYQLRAGGSLPPLLLEDEEAVAIAVGLRTAAAGAVSGMEETSVQALTKVIALMPPRLRRRMDALRSQTDNHVWGGGPTVDAAVLTTLAQACRDDEPLTLRLHRPRRRAHRPPRRAAPAGLARPPLVPRGLRPRPPGLALLPGRPDLRPGHHRPALPPARAARGGRRRVRAGRHPPDPPEVRRPRAARGRRRDRGAGGGPVGHRDRPRATAACSR